MISKLASLVGISEFLQTGFFGVYFVPSSVSISSIANQIKSDALNLMTGGFIRVSAPRVSINYQDVKSVNRLAPVYLPQSVDFGTITLEKGLTFIGSPLYRWIETYLDYGYEPKNIMIVHYFPFTSSEGPVLSFTYLKPSRVMVVHNAQPTSYGFSDFDGLSGEITIETLEVNYEWLDTYDMATNPELFGSLMVALGGL